MPVGCCWSARRTCHYLYETVYPEVGGIPADLGYVAGADQLARLDNAFHNDAGHVVADEYREVFRPWQAASVVFVNDLVAPLERTEYLAGGDTRYRQRYALPAGQVRSYLTRYDSGEQRDRSWWRQIARPGVRLGGDAEAARPAYQEGGNLVLELAEWVDAAGNWGNPGPGDSTAFRVLADGELVVEADRPHGEFPMAEGTADYRLELDVDRDAQAWTTSTATRTAWTLPGLASDRGGLLPLLLVDYDVDVDLSNTAPHPRDRRGPPAVELEVDHQPGVAGPEIAGARLWTSYDDGDTWRERSRRDLGDGRYQFILDARHPAHTNGFMTLRVEAWDADGNRITQEVTRAWQLPPR